MSEILRIGISTGGGDCPGLNAVIRAVVRSALRDFRWEVIGIEDGFDGLLKPGKTRPLDLSDVRGIIPRGGTILGTTNRGNPFHYPVEEAGQIVLKDLSDEVVRNLTMLQIDALVVIGGDGSLSIANGLFKKGVRVVGVPKTIDNDLSSTDVTFGFDTALRTATEAIDKLHTTAESHHRVMVLEVMGRDAGWIALMAGIAGAANIILIPEIPFHLEKVAEEVRRRDFGGHKSSIVVVAEGAQPAGGQAAFVEVDEQRGIKRLGGIGNLVADRIAALTGRETRVTVLGHLQRGGSPTPYDRVLASRFGRAAVHLLACGGFGRMVCLRGAEICDVSLEEAVGVLKKVQPDGELVATARSLGVTFGD